MKKIYFILAVAATFTFSSCMNDELVGGEQGKEETLTDAITFGGNTGKLTRATSNTGTAAEMLDNHFKVYGVKHVSSTWKDAFPNYVVASSTEKTPSNPDGNEGTDSNEKASNSWDYVGDLSAKGGLSNQTVKYWDYSASEYHFVAGSPASAFTFNLNGNNVTTATVTGLKGHITTNAGEPTSTEIAPIYIANPVTVPKGNYKQEVTFNFTRQQTFVRVGVYETIPGYKISKINFYEWDATAATPAWKATPATTQNIILASKTTGYFSGSESTGTTATITYNWPTTPVTTTTSTTYSFDYGTGLVEKNNWYGGALNGVPAVTSTDTRANLYGIDQDMVASTGYFTVLPTKSSITAQPILVKCDYELTSDGSDNETIKVTGATAAIPAAFTKWLPNTTYTYLFKISANTNGTTGDPTAGDPEGLFPISFDAVVTAEADGTAQGTITSVSTPSITTYQEGSVTTEGVKYVKNKAINFTAQDDETGALNTLTALDDSNAKVGMVKVYSLGTTAKTEADMILARPTTGITTTIGTAEWKSIGANKWASFTPNAAGYYAIEYITTKSPSVAYTYKIVYVAEL